MLVCLFWIEVQNLNINYLFWFTYIKHCRYVYTSNLMLTLAHSRQRACFTIPRRTYLSLANIKGVQNRSDQSKLPRVLSCYYTSIMSSIKISQHGTMKTRKYWTLREQVWNKINMKKSCPFYLLDLYAYSNPTVHEFINK